MGGEPVDVGWFKDADGKPYQYGFALSYYRLLRGRKQFTGVDGKQYDIAANPLTKVTALKECQRVQKCIEMVEAVFGKGQPEDPYRGQGNPDYPGVFYYKEKGNSPVHPGPFLPELTGKDHHFYQGLDEDYKP